MAQRQTSRLPEKLNRRVAQKARSSSSARAFQGKLPSPILQLQRTLGNRRVAQLIRARRLTPQGKIIGLQRKLVVGAADDQYEQEADRVARQVMSMPGGVAANTMQSEVSSEEDKDKAVQAKPLSMSTAPLVRRPMENIEEPEDKDATVQAKRSEGSLGLQRQSEMEEEEAEPIQAKSARSLSDSFEAGDDVENQLNRSKGGGSPLPGAVRGFMEPRFGMDFSQVRAHTGSEAIQMNRDVGAKAFTHGSDIYYGAGQNPGNLELTAHELTHVVQQGGAGAHATRQVAADVTLQRQHVADTGFRYTPPAAVKRSIVEIQGIAGTTPDGVYGENTRIAVEKYQTKLKAVGFYSDTLDGKWGNNTEAAHLAFAIAPNIERRRYNCAGFAFKDYKFHDLAATKAKYAAMTKLADCSKPCDPYFHKFWFWQFNLKTVHVPSGGSTPTLPDFHTVGGQTDGSGRGPDQVMSKNGQRPVEGPKPPLDWELKSGPAPHPVTGLPVPDLEWVVSGTSLECFCNDKLP